MLQSTRKSSFKVTFTKFGIAKEILPLVAFGLILATVDVYSDVALSYQFFTVNKEDYIRGTETSKSSGEKVIKFLLDRLILLTYSVTRQLLIVFPAVFDQLSGRFSKEDNSVGFKVFQILTSGCWCFKSAQKIAPATVG